ncbi:MAG: SDR family oxidoreductase [Treponemataceae bacterium]|nr:SDR family oxidoreductase [Treponemataceae bacterium]
MSEKTVLITGGAGFIGSHLCRRMLNEGNRVICLDNFFTGRESNISELRKNPKFSVINHDVELPYSFYADEIFNLACPASPPHYQRNPVSTYKTSIFGAIHALDLANKWNAKVFQASTSEVYGDPLVHPQPETYWGHVNTIGIRSCYDEGKRGAETLFMDYHRQFNTRIKIVRIFNTYGPMMNKNDGRVVSNFIVQALRGEDITIYGNGQQTRSFCYVDDLVEGFCRLMNTGDDITGPVNLGNPGEFTMLELAEKVLRLTGSKSKLVFKDLPQDDPKQRKPDITKAGEVLGWQPRIPLEEGLKHTIEYFKKEI